MPYLLVLMLLVTTHVNATSIYAGKAKATAVCSQCHGIKTPSADSPYPSLAGRDETYLKQALTDYRDKKRLSEIMNAVAGSLTDKDINNISRYYHRLKP